MVTATERTMVACIWEEGEDWDIAIYERLKYIVQREREQLHYHGTSLPSDRQR